MKSTPHQHSRSHCITSKAFAFAVVVQTTPGRALIGCLLFGLKSIWESSVPYNEHDVQVAQSTTRHWLPNTTLRFLRQHGLPGHMERTMMLKLFQMTEEPARPQVMSPSRTSRLGDVAENPTTQNIDAKRLIDRKFADPLEQSDMELWSFKVLSDASCKQMMIQVQFMGEQQKFQFEEVFFHGFSPRRKRLPRCF